MKQIHSRLIMILFLLMLVLNMLSPVRAIGTYPIIAGGVGVNILIKDRANSTVNTIGVIADAVYVPVGYIVWFGGFSVAPTVTVKWVAN